LHLAAVERAREEVRVEGGEGLPMEGELRVRVRLREKQAGEREREGEEEVVSGREDRASNIFGNTRELPPEGVEGFAGGVEAALLEAAGLGAGGAEGWAEGLAAGLAAGAVAGLAAALVGLATALAAGLATAAA
jgi:hypothetical protein